MQEGKGITLKDGRRILLKPKEIKLNDTNVLMNEKIRTLYPKSEEKILEEKSKKRYEELKEKYKDLTVDNGEPTVEEITLKPHSLGNKEYEEADIDFDFNYYGHYNDTTQKELNIMPIRIDTYIESENQWGYKETLVMSSVFKNRKDMERSFKQFGGIKEFTGGNKYTIKSQSGIGEYYLERDDLYKTGWVWKDVNFDNVKGYEFRDTTITRNKLERLKEENQKREEEMKELHPEWFN